MRNVFRNMRRTGMLLFRDAFSEACHGEKLMCVVHMAHAAEILLKARIAQEHPLLMFSKFPALSKNSKNTLGLIELLEKGRTLGYKELPNQLWATTGIKIERLDQYEEFGKIRNQIIHLSIPNSKKALDELALLYALDLLDPLVESFWGRSVFDFIKNDFLCDVNILISSGLLEEKIEKIHLIDERLRRLLGKASREGLEELKILSKIKISEFSESEEFNYNQITYEMIEESCKYVEDCQNDISQEELMEHWEKFLNSF